MARKFNVSIVNKYGETMSLEGCDSFDEAFRVLEQGVYHRELEMSERGVTGSPHNRSQLTPGTLSTSTPGTLSADEGGS